jgi:MFS family permease
MGATSLRFSGPLAMRFGPVATLLPGLIAIGASLLLFARTPDHASYVVDIMPAMALLGLGAGLAFPALTIVAMSGATPSDSGLASGLVNTSVNVGGALGLAVLATSAAERTHGLLVGGASAASALNSGYHLAYLISAALVLVAIGVVVIVLRPRRAGAEARAQRRLTAQRMAACGESA